MPDGAIVIPDTAAAPKDYTLSGAQEIALKSVRALIDGTGAGSAFLPTLQLLDPNGHVMWEGAAQSTVAAGGSADVSWFPVGAQLGGGTGAGAVISASAFSPPGFPTFAAGSHNLTFGSLIKNDATFSPSGGAPFQFIDMAHGGQVRVDATLSWQSDTGAPYVGEFIMQTQLLDTALSPVEQLVGPPATITEVYSTAVGDTFVTVGSSVFNTGSVNAGPPYHARLTFINVQSVGLNGYSMFAAIENPTGLT
jgi:hypothetical protein